MADEEENLVLVVNCSKYLSSEELIKQILGKELPSAQATSEIVDCYPWKIENKYYCADVKLLVINGQLSRPDWPIAKGQKTNAFVVIFDQIKSSFETVKQCLPYVESQDASVLLLVSSIHEPEAEHDGNEKTQALSRKQVIEWCTEHSFEFVDLNEEVDPEDDFPDTVGFDRIIQALQTTEWPTLQLKDSDHASTSSQPDGKKTEEQSLASEFTDDMLNGLTEEELDDDASFEQLFSQMKTMKEKAEGLPHHERKAYAEQVAVAFWRAIGGDDDEIGNLDEN